MSWSTTAALGALASTAAVASTALIASSSIVHTSAVSPSTTHLATVVASSSIVHATSLAPVSQVSTVKMLDPGVIRSILPLLMEPTINVTWPTPGAFLRFPAVLVQGTVSAPAGISVFTVNGTPVTPTNAAGDFQQWVPLPIVGMNEIDLVVTDNQSRSYKTSLAVLCGGYLDPGCPVDQGFVVRLNQGAFTAVSNAVTSNLSGQEIANAVMAQNPIVNWSGALGSSSTIYATSASFGDPVVTLSPESGDIRVHVDVPNVSLSFQEYGSWDIPNASGWVSCDNAAFDAQVSVSVVNGQLQTAIVNDNVNLVNFNWGINGLPGFLTGIFTGAVRNAIQGSVSNNLKNRLPPEVNKMLAAETGQQFNQTLLGQTATYSLTPGSVSVDSTGLTATAGANVTMTQVPGYRALPAPGSLTSFGCAPQLGPGPDLMVSLNDDLLNRFFFVAWQAGALNFHLDGGSNSTVSSLLTDLGSLQTFIPELNSVGSASDPIAIDVAPLLPPVVSSQAAPSPPLLGQFGQLEVTITDQATGRMVLKMVVHATMPIHAIDFANNVFIYADKGAQVDVTITDSAVPLNNPVEIDNVANLLLPDMLVKMLQNLSALPLPVYPGLTVWGASIYGDGPEQTFVSVATNFEPGGPTLPPAGK
jgi:hypothetical protein